VFVLLERAPNQAESRTMFVDTLVLDLERNKAITVYRGVLPWPRPESVEVRMEFQDPAETEAKMEVRDGER